MQLYQLITNEKKSKINNIHKKMIDSHLFTPCISSQVFAIAKSFGILKDLNMSQSEFDSCCKPALIKYWS